MALHSERFSSLRREYLTNTHPLLDYFINNDHAAEIRIQSLRLEVERVAVTFGQTIESMAADLVTDKLTRYGEELNVFNLNNTPRDNCKITSLLFCLRMEIDNQDHLKILLPDIAQAMFQLGYLSPKLCFEFIELRQFWSGDDKKIPQSLENYLHKVFGIQMQNTFTPIPEVFLKAFSND